MNHHEIETCVIRAKAGSSMDLLKLMEQYKPYIFKTAKGYNIKGYDMYDLAQVGYVTLINAVEKYKIGSHTFSSYAYNSISNAFRYTARRNKRFTEEFSLNAPVDDGEYERIEYIDCIASLENIEEAIINTESNIELKKAISSLSESELEFIIIVYYGNTSIKIYAEKKGMSYLQAIRFKNKIIEKLRKNIKR